MTKATAEHGEKAAEQHKEAASHHKEAGRHDARADKEKETAGHHDHVAHGSHSPEAAKDHAAGTKASGGSGFASIVSEQTYKKIFPHSNALYTRDGLIAAARKFPLFCNEGSSEQNRREAAAFLANISHETGALVFAEEQKPPIIYCDPSSKTYPCAKGKTYHGRGPLQLSWNYNYGACGRAIGKDLLNQPELVSTDSSITFMTALWFWMTPQAPKPSCHDAIRSSGFGMTINVINGEIECGKGAPTPQALDRVKLYQEYCGMLGVEPGGNLHC